MKQAYVPVPAGFYHQLEAFATLGTACRITFLQNESKVVARGRIISLYEIEKSAYLKMDTGLEIRLDALLDVNGVQPAYLC